MRFSAVELLAISLRLLLLVIVGGAPWMIGAASWASQYYLGWASVALAVGVAVYSLIASKKAAYFPGWVAVALALFVLFQLIPLSTPNSSQSWFSSIALQQSLLDVETEQVIQSGAASSDGLSSDVPLALDSLAISQDRAHSRAALVGLSMAAIVFVSAIVLFSGESLWTLIALGSISGNAFLIGLVGVIQVISPIDWHWFSFERGSPFATFVSKNSAAGFLNVGAAAAIALLVVSVKQKKKHPTDPSYTYPSTNFLGKIRGVLEDIAAEVTATRIALLVQVVFMVVAILVSLSRGGTIAAVAGCFVITAATMTGLGKRSGGLLAIVLGASAVGLLLWLEKYDVVSQRLESVTGGTGVVEDGRWIVWGYALNSLGSYWMTGAGLGNFHYAYLPFQDTPAKTWFYHAESIYWQALVDLGVLGLIALLACALALGICSWRLLRDNRSSVSYALGIGGGFLLVSQSIHGMVDFALVLPGVFLPCLLMAGIVYGWAWQRRSRRKEKMRSRQSSRRRGERSASLSATPMPSQVAVGTIVLLGILSSFAVFGLLGLPPRIAAEEIADLEAKWKHDGKDASGQLDRLIGQSRSALATNPDDGELNLLLAQLLISKFRLDSMSAPNVAATKWELTQPLLVRANYYVRAQRESLTTEDLVGDPARAKLLLEAKKRLLISRTKLPLDWRPAWGLVQLDFVEPRSVSTKACMNQVAILAKNQPKLITSLGLAAVSYPDLQTAKEMWRIAMQFDSQQAMTIAPLALSIPDFPSIEDDFFPLDPEVLIKLASEVITKERSATFNEQLWKLANTAALEMPDDSGLKYKLLALIAKNEGRIRDQIESLQTALNRLPMDGDLRIELIYAWYRVGEFERAKNEIERYKLGHVMGANLEQLYQELSGEQPKPPSL